MALINGYVSDYGRKRPAGNINCAARRNGRLLDFHDWPDHVGLLLRLRRRLVYRPANDTQCRPHTRLCRLRIYGLHNNFNTGPVRRPVSLDGGTYHQRHKLRRVIHRIRKLAKQYRHKQTPRADSKRLYVCNSFRALLRTVLN